MGVFPLKSLKGTDLVGILKTIPNADRTKLVSAKNIAAVPRCVTKIRPVVWQPFV